MRSENKAKDTVVYPNAFQGNLGVYVYKFVKEFKRAVIESQVIKSDQVKTLGKYLGGKAREVWRPLHRPGVCTDCSNQVL